MRKFSWLLAALTGIVIARFDLSLTSLLLVITGYCLMHAILAMAQKESSEITLTPVEPKQNSPIIKTDTTHNFSGDNQTEAGPLKRVLSHLIILSLTLVIFSLPTLQSNPFVQTLNQFINF
jgi:hypothetical protein